MVVENMLDDLFKTVTKRFYGEEGAHAHEQPTFKCPRCQHTVLLTVFQEAGKVCPNCRYHARLTAKERLQITADANSFVEYDAELESLDPLSFPNYAEKVAQLQEKTGLKDAVLTGECTIQGSRAVIIIMDSHFMMASMGSAVGKNYPCF
jgi:acetyl-CoA carboxylase carboxyl transferase subunit beta